MWKIVIKPSSKRKEDRDYTEKAFFASYPTKEEAEEAKKALIELVQRRFVMAPSCEEYTGRSKVVFRCPQWYIGEIVED